MTSSSWAPEIFNIGSNRAPMGHFSAVQKNGYRIILQLHGGDYVRGMSNNHRLLGLKYATTTNASDVFSKYVYLGALEDAVAACEELLTRGISLKILF